MRVEFHTGEESPDFLFEVSGDQAHVTGLPLIGDRVVWEYIDWVVNERSWKLAQGEEPVLEIWLRKE